MANRWVGTSVASLPGAVLVLPTGLLLSGLAQLVNWNEYQLLADSPVASTWTSSAHVQ